MSYVDEIVDLGRHYQYSTLIVGDPMTETQMSNSDSAVWTYVGNTKATFKRNVQTCCISNSSRKKCVVDLKRLIGNMYLESERIPDKHYSWEQYDISIFCKGNITDSDNVIGGAVITRPIVIKATTGSIARVIVTGVSSTVLDIQVNSIKRGSILFAPGSASGIITIFSDIEMNDGDVVSIVSTSTFDNGTQDYVITLSGIAQNVVVWDTLT